MEEYFINVSSMTAELCNFGKRSSAACDSKHDRSITVDFLERSVGGAGGSDWSGGVKSNLLPNYFKSIHFSIAFRKALFLVLSSHTFGCPCVCVCVCAARNCAIASAWQRQVEATAMLKILGQALALRFSSLAMKQINCKSFSKYFHKALPPARAQDPGLRHCSC